VLLGCVLHKIAHTVIRGLVFFLFVFVFAENKTTPNVPFLKLKEVSCQARKGSKKLFTVAIEM